MGTKTLSQVIGGSHGIRMAVDTDWPKDKSDAFVLKAVGGIDTTGGPTTILSLTGKFVIHTLWMSLLTTNDVARVKLTVDGIVVWDVDPLTNATLEPYIGSDTVTAKSGHVEGIICDSSFLFEFQCDVDTSIQSNFMFRPIL